MNYGEFKDRIESTEKPVILLEGTRALPGEERPQLVALAEMLAREFPEATFRTGNAQGADEAFAEGVCKVDPSRLEFVLPYSGHRKKMIPDGSYQIALSELPQVAEERVAYESLQASPEYSSMVGRRHDVPQLKTKSRYILRDTLKVTGLPESDLLPATVGIFYVNIDDPMKGGTGHTIRVCREKGVPVVFQSDWNKWPTKDPSSSA